MPRPAGFVLFIDQENCAGVSSAVNFAVWAFIRQVGGTGTSRG
jgi:hypothetical protein